MELVSQPLSPASSLIPPYGDNMQPPGAAVPPEVLRVVKRRYRGHMPPCERPPPPYLHHCLMSILSKIELESGTIIPRVRQKGMKMSADAATPDACGLRSPRCSIPARMCVDEGIRSPSPSPAAGALFCPTVEDMLTGIPPGNFMICSPVCRSAWQTLAPVLPPANAPASPGLAEQADALAEACEVVSHASPIGFMSGIVQGHPCRVDPDLLCDRVLDALMMACPAELTIADCHIPASSFEALSSWQECRDPLLAMQPRASPACGIKLVSCSSDLQADHERILWVRPSTSPVHSPSMPPVPAYRGACVERTFSPCQMSLFHQLVQVVPLVQLQVSCPLVVHCQVHILPGPWGEERLPARAGPYHWHLCLPCSRHEHITGTEEGHLPPPMIFPPPT